ncbi:hypothetical protein ACQ86K_01265 [Mucilaginibacter sp. P19]|uniref:hypothetical protein n=1 Tax=Mucilaginibacter sp. P19 TaxID=3423947 RepID=UPI003D6733A6
MKKLKVGLLALLLTAGIGGAVVQKIQAAPKAGAQEYSWNNGEFTGTEAEARTHYSCPTGSNVTCATGTADGVPDLVIKKP